MKRSIFALLLLILLSVLTSKAQGISGGMGNNYGHTISFTVTLQPVDDLTPELPPIGDRQSPERLPACVSDGGVTIEQVSESEIESYDIYTPSGILLDSFGSGEAFATSLFSLEGEYEVRFTTSEYVYIGYVCIEK